MPKYIITWDVGFGEEAEVIDAETMKDAELSAYEAAREAFESNAKYSAEEYSAERAEELGAE